MRHQYEGNSDRSQVGAGHRRRCGFQVNFKVLPKPLLVTQTTTRALLRLFFFLSLIFSFNSHFITPKSDTRLEKTHTKMSLFCYDLRICI